MTKLSVLLLLAATSATALADGESSYAAAKSRDMDYGPVLGTTVSLQTAKSGSDLNGMVIKGLAIQLKDGGAVRGAACFDTMLCRWAGAWLADEGKPPLKLIGTPFDGSHGTCPKAQGPVLFHAGPTPGWALDGQLTDPRANPYVPLPKDRAHYRGLYVHGDQVVLSYTVQAVPVLEQLVLKSKDGLQWCDRILEVGPTKAPLTVVICDAPDSLKEPRDLVTGDLAEFKDDGGAATTLGLCAFTDEKSVGLWRLIDHKVCLEIPPLAKATRVQVSLWHGPADKQPDRLAWQKAIGSRDAIPSLAPLTRGGPARYPQTITTAGKLGHAGGAYEVDTLALPEENPWKAWMRPTGFDFFADGKSAAFCTWSGDVWTVSGIDDSLAKLEWRRIATGLFQPLGLKVVDGQIYVLGRDQITRLRDLNGDGETDFYENFNNDVSCTPNYHEFAADLQTDAAGNFYFCKNSPLKGAYEWDKAGPHNGCMLRVSKDGSRLDIIATGLRATNGCGVGPHGEITNADNEGIWTPVSRINWVGTAGAPAPALPPFFGALGMDHRAEPPKAYDPPLCWLPWGMDNSPGGQAWAGDKFGPLSHSMLHLSYGKCAVFQVLFEETGGVKQGGIVKVPVNFASGAMRARFNPGDGQLYVCGLRGWQTTAARDGCLQRLRYAGKPLDLVTALHVRPAALEITVSTPLDPATATDPGNWDVQWWNYRWTKNYGSDIYSISDPTKSIGKRGQLTGEAAPLKAIRLSSDGKTITVEIPTLMPVMQLITRANLKTAAGAPFKIEIAHTINKVPQ